MVHEETQVSRESIPPRMKGQSFKRKGLPSFFFLCRSWTGCLKVQQQPLCNHEEESHTMRMESSRAGRQREPGILWMFLWMKSRAANSKPLNPRTK